MRILGIDPGIATIGFALLEADSLKYNLLRCGVISTPAHTALSSRLEIIYSDLNQVIAAFQPEAVAIEELFFNTNITTGISVAHGRGISRTDSRLITSHTTSRRASSLYIRNCQVGRPT